MPDVLQKSSYYSTQHAYVFIKPISNIFESFISLILQVLKDWLHDDWKYFMMNDTFCGSSLIHPVDTVCENESANPI